MHNQVCSEIVAEVKASSPIRTSLYEREGSMWGSLKRPSLRREDEIFPCTFKAIRKRLGIPQPSDISHRISMIDECRSDDNALCHEMLTTFGFTQDQMHRAAERFHLGRSKSGKTIYWMIDDIGRCLDGHIGDAWVSTMLKARYPDLAHYIIGQHCLFGLHQISMINFDSNFGSISREATPKSIGIVESERSAVLLSELCPDLLWLAYSYPINMTIEKFEPLQGRKITLYPRTDPNMESYISFLELADQVHRTYRTIDITVSHFLEDNATDDQKQRNIDLLEFMLEK